jgi:hypothetical protein
MPQEAFCSAAPLHRCPSGLVAPLGTFEVLAAPMLQRLADCVSFMEFPSASGLISSRVSGERGLSIPRRLLRSIDHISSNVYLETVRHRLSGRCYCRRSNATRWRLFKVKVYI